MGEVRLPLAEAKKIPGVRAVFGEKYPDPVRVIAIGTEDPVAEPDSACAIEFCGGTHLRRTSQVGFLKILSEESVAKGVRRITAVIPYFGYARQDRKTEGRTPITAKLVANLISQAGAHRVLAMDLHAEQIQGFFDLPLDHLTALPVLASHVKGMGLKDCVVVSPDVGNLKRATAFAQRLGAELAVIDKRRLGGESTTAIRVIGDVAGKTVLLFDDMITTAGTATEAIRILRGHGSKKFLLAATHPVLAGPALDRLDGTGVDWLITTDTIPLRPKVTERLPGINVLSVAPLLGEAIQRIHLDQSVSALFRDGDR